MVLQLVQVLFQAQNFALSLLLPEERRHKLDANARLALEERVLLNDVVSIEKIAGIPLQYFVIALIQYFLIDILRLNGNYRKHRLNFRLQFVLH